MDTRTSFWIRRASCELVALICAVIRLHYNVSPYNTQVIALLAQIKKPPESRGIVAQVRTGEGKSLIIAMKIIYLGCQGHCVDALTSSEALAIRDWLKYKSLYLIFGLTSSIIAYDQLKPEYFDAQILIGTSRNYHFAILNDLSIKPNSGV